MKVSEITFGMHNYANSHSQGESQKESELSFEEMLAEEMRKLDVLSIKAKEILR